MATLVELTPGDNNETDQWLNYRGNYHFHTDKILGHIIISLSLGDTQGAEVYMAHGFYHECDLMPGEIAALANRRNLYKELMPWFSTAIPTHNDQSEPAVLTIRHIPDSTTFLIPVSDGV